MIVEFHPQDTPAGKLADAELHFTEGPLAGLRLVGFAVWEARHEHPYHADWTEARAVLATLEAPR